MGGPTTYRQKCHLSILVQSGTFGASCTFETYLFPITYTPGNVWCKTEIPEIFESWYGKIVICQYESYTLSLRKSYYELESLRHCHWIRLAFSGLARSAGTVVFPLGLGESVLAFPLTTRLTLHLFCRYSPSLSLLLFLWLITFALVVMHACRWTRISALGWFQEKPLRSRLVYDACRASGCGYLSGFQGIHQGIYQSIRVSEYATIIGSR